MLTSLRKRAWMIVLSVLAVKVLLLVSQAPLWLSVTSGLFVLIAMGASVAWSSYTRHQNDLDFDQ